MTKTWVLKINSQIRCFIPDSYSSSKGGRVYCANIIRRNGTQVSHVPSFSTSFFIFIFQKFLAMCRIPMQALSTLCRDIPLNMVQNNSFSFTFHSRCFKMIHSLLPSSELFSKNKFLKRKMKNFFKLSVYLIFHNGTFKIN
jgi:hypothetical protein